MTGYASGRGGRREGAGRPKGSKTVDIPPTKVLRVPREVTKQEVEAIPSVKTAMVAWKVLIDKEPGSPRYHFLKQFLDELEALGLRVDDKR